MDKYYLAYGSNLNLALMKKRCSFAEAIGCTILNDCKLAFKGSADDYSYLTIEKEEGSYVPLGVYKINILDEFKLDRYEGYPNLYRKEFIEIELGHKKVKALIYIMNDGFDKKIPSNQYLDICYQGYRDFSFDQKILDKALEDVKDKEKVMKKR